MILLLVRSDADRYEKCWQPISLSLYVGGFVAADLFISVVSIHQAGRYQLEAMQSRLDDAEIRAMIQLEICTVEVDAAIC